MTRPVDPASSTPKLTRHEITVLLIDDQLIIGEAIRHMLAADKDIVFHHCVDPKDAFATAKKVRPTVILQDLVMPGVEGLTLVRYLRANRLTKDVPIIVLSTKEEAHVKASAFGLGANDYIVKLPDRIELVARIRYHSRGYINMLERNEAYEALVQSQKQLEIRNRFIRDTFGRYLSDEIVESLLETPEGLNLGGEKRNVTIMMTDLRGFTPLTERLTPEQVVSVINNYLAVMTDIIQGYGGTIDEFIGDAILVLFGAPIARDDHAARALACALAMQLAMPGVNEKNEREGLPEVEMGIGLHTGEAIVGNIGSNKRAKYGVVGSAVNLTSRIESFTVGGQILASQAAVTAAGPSVRVAGERMVEPKGVKEPVKICDVTGIGEPFNLNLTRSNEVPVPLPTPIPVGYTVIEGKDSGGELRSGSINALSRTLAELRPEAPLPREATLRMRLEGDGLAIPVEDFYGKTTTVERDVVVVRLTSVPPPVREFLRTLSSASARAP